MGMWSSRNLGWQAFVRGLLALLGLLGVLWSSAVAPSFWLTALAHEVSVGIIADDRFKPGALGAMLALMETQSNAFILQPQFSKAKALLGLRVAEEAMGWKSSEDTDREMEGAEAKLRSALCLTPMDSFLWLMLYSVETARYGFELKNFALLGQSYMTAPLEGWIALRRNKVALAILPMLNGPSQENVVSEFAAMVESDFIDYAAFNLTSVGWEHRERLLSGLEHADIIRREAFAKKLARDGVKASVPGIEIDERPWR